ncbi:MAG: hypothetical protein JXB03_10575 [Spirochaetales bacterium]|nr:hypothetical protein [Spirochaetales bacterium]
MKIFLSATVICMAALIAAVSCVTPIVLDEVTRVDLEKAYLFGRFGMAYTGTDNESVYLIVQSKDGIREHLFPFNKADNLGVKEVIPGDYQIVGYRVVTGNRTRDYGFFSDQNQRMMDIFTLGMGEGMYLGDYTLQTPVQDSKTSSPGAVRILIQNKIEAARYQLRRQYPAFEEILTVNLMR